MNTDSKLHEAFSDNHEQLRRSVEKAVYPIKRDCKVILDTSKFISSLVNLQTVLWEVIYNPQKKKFWPYQEIVFPWAYYYEEVMSEIKQIRLYFDMQPTTNPDKYPRMYADAPLMSAVVYNLLSNAFKYSFDNTTVKLEVFEEKGNYIVRTTNYGYNAPEKSSIKNIYEKGERGDNIKAIEDGNGIGLFLCHEIVSGHGGIIEHSSEEIFAYNLPLAEYTSFVADSLSNNTSVYKNKYAKLCDNERDMYNLPDFDGLKMLLPAIRDAYAAKLSDDKVLGSKGEV